VCLSGVLCGTVKFLPADAGTAFYWLGMIAHGLLQKAYLALELEQP